MTEHDATEVAYKNGFEAGLRSRDHEGWYAMELTEALDRLTEDKKELQKLLFDAIAELRNDVRKLSLMVENDITMRKIAERQKDAKVLHP